MRAGRYRTITSKGNINFCGELKNHLYKEYHHLIMKESVGFLNTVANQLELRISTCEH
jgi:hypothetical protein